MTSAQFKFLENQWNNSKSNNDKIHITIPISDIERCLLESQLRHS